MPTANSNGYSSLSVALHWLGAFCVIVLFITHEGARDSTAYAIHVGGGALMGVVLLWRVWNRISKGKPERPKQHALLNLLADVVLWGLLAAVFIVTVTGYVLPWSLGQPLDIFGIVSLPSPMGRSPGRPHG